METKSRVITEITYDNLKDFYKDFLREDGKLLNEFMCIELNAYYIKFLFRGVPSDEYDLTPKALRLKNISDVCELAGINSPSKGINTELQQIKSEESILRKFFQRCDSNGLRLPTINRIRYPSDNFGSSEKEGKYGNYWLPDDMFELAGLAQHYGLPTRLLDWTTNFYTAIYFAIKDIKEDVKYFSIWAYNYHDYLNIFSSTDKIRMIIPEYSQNPNINAQKGVFTLWQKYRYKNIEENPVDTRPLDKLIESQIHDGERDYSKMFYKINIPVKYSKELYKYINMMGVDSATQFPGYDGVTQSLKDDAKYINQFQNEQKLIIHHVIADSLPNVEITALFVPV